MRKEQFLKELEALLQDISEQERVEALQYYRDYFDDAGPEKEADIMEELGSPIRVARIIKEGLSENDGEFSERGYRDNRFADSQELGYRNTAQGSHTRGNGGETQPTPKQANGWKIACLILLCILLFPIIIPLGLAVIAVLFSILVAVLALVAGIGISSVAILVSGIITVIVGFVHVFRLPVVGIAVTGVGFLLMALGMLLTIAMVWCGVKIVPWLIRGTVKVLRYPFQKRKEAGEA
ncbi:MAG: DUF1700 domain-containing protein [Lachnospiraceae bacterium]|jgi:uncharacterized membrane protein|nr:DUF1700 domain-containing protein [Lachnospiraceae bacterium]MCI8996357.1 DUF1700 domain-containing protein [Lachnospiraceae bacterium]MCI9133967.1 DUF1700 domain-containing protein [Lachnospiraceae bacterium]